MRPLHIIIRKANAGYTVTAPKSFYVYGSPMMDTVGGFADQSSAEHYAAGVAAGLRACGRSCEVVIDVPEADDDEGMLDMGALDKWAQQPADRAAIDPEADPVERRLAREAESGRFIAEARGL